MGSTAHVFYVVCKQDDIDVFRWQIQLKEKKKYCINVME